MNHLLNRLLKEYDHLKRTEQGIQKSIKVKQVQLSMECRKAISSEDKPKKVPIKMLIKTILRQLDEQQ